MLLLPVQGFSVNSSPRTLAQNSQQKQLTKSHSQPACDTVSFTSLNTTKFANRAEEQIHVLTQLIKEAGGKEFVNIQLRPCKGAQDMFLSAGETYSPKQIQELGRKIEQVTDTELKNLRAFGWGSDNNYEKDLGPCIKSAHDLCLKLNRVDLAHKSLKLSGAGIQIPAYFDEAAKKAITYDIKTPFILDLDTLAESVGKVHENFLLPGMFRHIGGEIYQSPNKQIEVIENGEKFLVSMAPRYDGSPYSSLLINKVYN